MPRGVLEMMVAGIYCVAGHVFSVDFVWSVIWKSCDTASRESIMQISLLVNSTNILSVIINKSLKCTRRIETTKHDQIPPRFPSFVFPSLSLAFGTTPKQRARPRTTRRAPKASNRRFRRELETLFTTRRLTALQHPRFICARSPIGRRRTLLLRTAIDSASDIITVPRAAVSYDGGPARRCKAGGGE